ncbi:Quinoprotein glucose dehydrogenase B precursor [Candidatus Nitrosocosmicus oleophilus]|uniref:Quinoprotein glucose dehydrogenase B n=2 Tax=Candidatus Nitrosocosmicus oleophilus TaxID=1353260 RepID=A0A654LYH0_9ARCH|nr:Quinoprotein glucose dehydrogenase B precursor [Candidatus Nitrosocosmicus oleophilus]
MIFALTNHKNVKFSFKHSIMTLALFGLIILSVVPAMLSGFFNTKTVATTATNIVPIVLAQGEDPFPSVVNEKLTPAQQQAREQLLKEQGFSVNVIAKNLSAPLNLLYGPDNALWITERVGKDVLRVDPINGTILSKMPIPNVNQSGGQDGVLGMAFDPNFNSTNHIYIAYTYEDGSVGVPDLRTKITQFTFDPSTNNISEPKDLITGLSGSSDHNSGRMTFGPDGKLYYTIGDQGKNQLALACLNNMAQHLPTTQQVAANNWSTYEGKVLRMNPDGSIPEDNPVINGVQSHIYTYGHRNAQGITVGPTGDIYISEHGDNSDDEVNRLVAGGNYGWPYVSGYIDDKAYQYYNWSAAKNCPELKFNDVAPAPPGVTVKNESEFNATNFVPPIATFYTVEKNFNFTQAAKSCGKMASTCYPTVAPSSLRLYTSDTIPGWENSLLMTTLKGGKIIKITLDDNGTAVKGKPQELFRSENRYRDIAFSPDGSTVYVITDMGGPVQAIKEGPITPTTTLWSPGALIAFKYMGAEGGGGGGNSTTQ